MATIIVGNKVEANEISLFNFETDTTGDDTYNDAATIAWKGSGNEAIDASKAKFGSQSVTTTAGANALEIDWGADQGTSWTIEGYIAIGQAQYNAQGSKPTLFKIVPNTGDATVLVVDGDSTSPNFGKLSLDVGSSTFFSSSTTNWTRFAA